MKASVNGTVYETEARLFGIVYRTLSRQVVWMFLPDSEEELCYLCLNKDQSLLIAEEGSANPANVFDCQRLVEART